MLWTVCQMSADDTKVFAKIEKESVAKWQQDLDSLTDWADCCQLCSNAANCKVLDLGQNNPKHVYNMKTHGTWERVSIGASVMVKDLGVLVDTDLKFSKHVEE